MVIFNTNTYYDVFHTANEKLFWIEGGCFYSSERRKQYSTDATMGYSCSPIPNRLYFLITKPALELVAALLQKQPARFIKTIRDFQ